MTSNVENDALLSSTGAVKHDGSPRKIRRALVTGGAGFIGSHLVNALVRTGAEVVSFDDYSAGDRDNLSSVRSCGNFTEFAGDITDPIAVRKAMAGADTVFHQAASKKTVCMRDPSRDLAVNGGGALLLLQAAIESGGEKFVHASTGISVWRARDASADGVTSP